jgi:tetraacyldisaccharide 4'-kinase
MTHKGPAFMSAIRHIFWNEERAQPHGWAVPLLWPASQVYRAIVLGRAKFAAPGRRLPAPVVSVGNLVVGGTGKTPAALWIAEYLVSQGRRPAILSRGYGGRAGRGPLVVSDGSSLLADSSLAGDEPAMLGTRARGAVVVAGSDRHLCGLHAAQELGADCFILDDGFQHCRLHRDLDLLLLDSSRPFGNGRLLPAGTMREPREAVERADMVMLTRWDQRNGGETDREEVARAVGGRNIVFASHGYVGLVAPGGGPGDCDASAGVGALLVSGIAAPRYFEETARRAGHEVLGHLTFVDHHRYSQADVDMVTRRARELGAGVILTTEKDAVRFPGGAWKLDPPICCVRVDLVIEKGLAAFREALDGLFG